MMTWFRFLMIILMSPCGIFAADFYVAVNGSDVNPGTMDAPFATLGRARDHIRSLGGTDAVTVWIRNGTYVLDESFVLKEADSGSAARPIEYRAWPGEKTRLSGGNALPAEIFTPVSDEKILTRLMPQAREHVVQADLKAQGIIDYGEHQQYGHALPVVPAPMELFFNDTVMTLARYPNEGYILMGKVVDTGSVPRIRDYENIRGGTFEYTDERHARWAGQEDVWLQGTFKWGYADDKIRIDWIDPEKNLVKLSTPHMYGLGYGEPHQHYVALNILEELDSPGEWYVDRTSGMLYFWPPADLSEARITVSMLESPMIVLERASHITLRDLIIEDTRGMGIYIEGGSHNLIEGCTLRNIGTSAVFMGQGARQTFPHITHDDYDGVPVSREIGNLQGHIYKYTTWDRKAGHHHGVLNCLIYNTGCGGVVLSGGSKKDLIAGHCYVENCSIHDYNRRNKFLWAGINIDGCGNRIAHNDIFNSEFQAIYVHGNEHVFEFNLIHHIATNSNDTSPWYIGRDPSDRGHVIRYNFFHHCGNPERKWTMGIYFDDASCESEVYGNVFYKVGSYGTIYSNAGHDLTIRNNIFVAGYGPVLHIKSMWYDFGLGLRDYYFGENGVYRQRLLERINIKEPPYSTKYSKLVDWMDLMPDGETYVGMHPRRNLFEKNLVYQYGQTYVWTGEYAQFELKDNYVSLTDPGFVDMDNLNFQLRDDSIVYDKIPGFARIPFEKIGRYQAE
ncbi:MAG: right-handed parallel beta-helix repeat-containing protein [candidate division KSB1 bacterium]|nr:right-handed parallel beta-helix repeat-containing protein [candidate division KSB1 bacterium]